MAASLESKASCSRQAWSEVAEAPLPIVAMRVLSFYYFPWARASNPLRAGILQRDTGNYFSRRIDTTGDRIEPHKDEHPGQAPFTNIYKVSPDVTCHRSRAMSHEVNNFTSSF